MAAKRLWTETYRPATFEGYVFQNAQHEQQLKKFLTEGDIPHLLLTGTQGSGKTTISKILINELGVEDTDILKFNASKETGVDFIRDVLLPFAEAYPIGQFKVIQLEECLHEDTLIWILDGSQEKTLQIKHLKDDRQLVKSFNIESKRIEWRPFKLFDKGVQEIFEIALEDGSIILCTEDHKWFVQNSSEELIVVKTSELPLYEHIMSYKGTEDGELLFKTVNTHS